MPVLPIQHQKSPRLDAQVAREIGETHSGEYQFAEPFPHIVFEDFLPVELAQTLISHFPKAALASDINYHLGYAGDAKRQIFPEDCSDDVRPIFHFFNSQPMLQFLEGLTGIQGLLPDPYFVGGGFHETGVGGKLGIHADFRINDALHLNRRMNLILYLNEDWLKEYGGELELWDRKMNSVQRKIAPIFNRCVIFNTDEDSFHGHPDPITCPTDVKRRSLALYYYTASKSIYNETPNTGTLYKARPNDNDSIKREALDLQQNQWIKQWIPPALWRSAFAMKRAIQRKSSNKKV